jgi:hypothetical protein
MSAAPVPVPDSVLIHLQAFCDELETMIQDQMKTGKTPTSLLALQQIADFMTTSMPSMYPAAPQGGMAALNMSESPPRPASRAVWRFSSCRLLMLIC